MACSRYPEGGRCRRQGKLTEVFYPERREVVDHSYALSTPLAAARFLDCSSEGVPVPSNGAARDRQAPMSLELALEKRSQGSSFKAGTEQLRLAPMRVCCSAP